MFDKDELYDLYINKQLSTRKIADIKGCSFGAVKYDLKKFNINISDRNNINKLTNIQNDISIGSFLGDGSFQKSYNGKNANYRLSIFHAEDQKNYLQYKLDIMANLCKADKIKSSSSNKDRSWTNSQMMYYFHSKQLPVFNRYGEMTITDALDELNENSMLIWFLDDGNLYRKEYDISAKRFTYRETEYAIDIIQDKFNIIAKFDWEDKEHTVCKGIRFDVSESKKMLDIFMNCELSHLLTDTMSYKIIPQTYKYHY